MNAIKRIIIFGATSAIAEATARQLVSEGASLYCVARNEAKLNAIMDDLRIRADRSQIIEGTVADLMNCDQHYDLIMKGESALGGFDSVLIAYGTLPDQKACEKDVEQTLTEIHNNGTSVISLLTHLGNYFEAKQSGVIGVISSVAGDRGRQSNYIYGAAKGMVSLFLQGLRNRLSKAKVDVVTIKPGFVKTPMTAEFDRSGPLWANPEVVAKGIIKAMKRGRNEIYLLWFWRWIMFIIKSIPEFIFKRLSL